MGGPPIGMPDAGAPEFGAELVAGPPCSEYPGPPFRSDEDPFWFCELSPPPDAKPLGPWVFPGPSGGKSLGPWVFAAPSGQDPPGVGECRCASEGPAAVSGPSGVRLPDGSGHGPPVVEWFCTPGDESAGEVRVSGEASGNHGLAGSWPLSEGGQPDCGDQPSGRCGNTFGSCGISPGECGVTFGSCGIPCGHSPSGGIGIWGGHSPTGGFGIPGGHVPSGGVGMPGGQGNSGRCGMPGGHVPPGWAGGCGGVGKFGGGTGG